MARGFLFSQRIHAMRMEKAQKDLKNKTTSVFLEKHFHKRTLSPVRHQRCRKFFLEKAKRFIFSDVWLGFEYASDFQKTPFLMLICLRIARSVQGKNCYEDVSYRRYGNLI